MADNISAGNSTAAPAASTYLAFQPYPLQVGHKIFIESGPRRGDWEVIAVSERKVGLRCPFSGKEVEWDRFCYIVGERNGQWPHPE